MSDEQKKENNRFNTSQTSLIFTAELSASIEVLLDTQARILAHLTNTPLEQIRLEIIEQKQKQVESTIKILQALSSQATH